MRAPFLRYAAAIATVFLASVATPRGAASAGEELHAVRPADTSSPRGTLKTFIDSCNELHRLIESERYLDRNSPAFHPIAVRILDCLDVSELPDYAREDLAGEAAVCIKEILDRVELPPYDKIPDTKAIEAAGGAAKLSRWRVPGTRLTIARVEEGPQRHEYLFTPGTVQRAPEYYEDVKSIDYRTTGPEVTEGFHRWFLSTLR